MGGRDHISIVINAAVSFFYFLRLHVNRAMEDELRVETEKHRHTRDELKSSKANLQYTKTQFAVSALFKMHASRFCEMGLTSRF